MSKWSNAVARSDAEGADGEDPIVEPQAQVEAGTGVVPPSRAPLIIATAIDVLMLDMNVTGARLLIEPMTRLEAQDLAKKHPDAITYVSAGRDEWATELLEKEVGCEVQRPRLGMGSVLLLVLKRNWKDIRFFKVTYECDGDGCVE